MRRIDEGGSLRFRVEGAPAEVARRVPVEGQDDGEQIWISPFEVSPDRIAVSLD